MNDYTVVDYILDSNIEGAFVECGVQTGKIEKNWINGLKRRNIKSRDIYMYDTFTGLTEPSERDIGISNGMSSEDVFQEWPREAAHGHRPGPSGPRQAAEAQGRHRQAGYRNRPSWPVRPRRAIKWAIK